MKKGRRLLREVESRASASNKLFDNHFQSKRLNPEAGTEDFSSATKV